MYLSRIEINKQRMETKRALLNLQIMHASVKACFGVRIDQPGTLLRDYHVAHKNEFWKTGKTDPFLSERYYLADAVFLAGLSGDLELLKTIDEALNAPKLPIYLGRRSCPPSGQVSLGLHETGLVKALRDKPWLASDWYKRRHQVNSLEIIRDAEEGVVTQDLPLSFNPRNRRYRLRATAREAFATPPASLAPAAASEPVDTSHDPFTALGGDLNVSVTG
jgi:CRISPR system Cascade subunit CasD